MYIWDALYGRIEFDSMVYRCMLSPEVQRLREVRLCNINSLCITGSSNTNRFEHSVGTAFLALVNIESDAQKHLKLSDKEKEIFVISALLHDAANGPYGHSYEYIMEKQGFVPEKGLGDVLSNDGAGVYKKAITFEPIFFGKLKTLNNILDDYQKNEISSIILGNHALSELISSSIDLDNIDNVFRMAYHMGLRFSKEAPKKLAESMFISDGKVLFKKDAESYLHEWFEVRRNVYKFLLLNPQEFAGKYMLTEAMDILFECVSQKKAGDKDIKWYYTDFELMERLNELTEVWLPRRALLFNAIDSDIIHGIIQIQSENDRKTKLRKYLESLSLTIPIKEKGKSGNSNKLQLSDNYVLFMDNGLIKVNDRNMEFLIDHNKLYKIVNIRYNPSQIVSRLMTGDLYDCLLILETCDITKYDDFLDYAKRISIEVELETRIKAEKEKAFARLSIGIHPILDKNKTERQLTVLFEDSEIPAIIGEASSRKLLIGIFLKNEPYGLSHGKTPLSKYRDSLIKIVIDYFASYFDDRAKIVPLYEEVKYGYY